MKKYSILIVEDDKAIRSLIQTALEAEQFGAITALQRCIRHRAGADTGSEHHSSGSWFAGYGRHTDNR